MNASMIALVSRWKLRSISSKEYSWLLSAAMISSGELAASVE